MFSQIKRLGADTAVYGISTIIGRFFTFLLVPFYTNVLTTGEYGVIANVYAYVAVLNVIYAYGMESAYFRFAGIREIGDESQNFSTPLLSIILTSTFFSGLMLLLAKPLTTIFQIEPEFDSVIRYSAGILFFDALVIVPFASLRLERRAKRFAGIKLINIFTVVTLNVITLVWFRWGIEGVFFSNLMASLLTFLLLIPQMRKHLTFKFLIPLYRSLLKFGLPYIPIGLSGMLQQVFDRPMLKAFTDSSTVGIYQANYRMGVVMNILTSMFDYAWKPFFLSHAKEPNAKQLFARVLTYFVLVTSSVFLVVSFFIRDIVSIKFFGYHLIHQDYWSGLDIVPVVLMAYLFAGISLNLTAGVFIEKKTNLLLINSMIAAGTNIVMNLILIPTVGFMGAAYSSMISFGVGAIALYIVLQRVYPIRYEYRRLGILAISVITLYGMYLLARFEDIDSIPIRLVLLVCWPLLLFILKFFSMEELARIKAFVRRR